MGIVLNMFVPFLLTQLLTIHLYIHPFVSEVFKTTQDKGVFTARGLTCVLCLCTSEFKRLCFVNLNAG